jgi:hypothetical protein
MSISYKYEKITQKYMLYNYLEKFVVPNEKLLSKRIEIIHFDGTFKYKFMKGLNYNVLFFCTLSIINKIIPMGFIISFNNSNEEWEILWKGIKNYYKNYLKKGIFSPFFISDLGSGELKFIRENIPNKFHKYCWFHMEEIFSKYINLKVPESQQEQIWEII